MSKPILSILVCHTEGRQVELSRLRLSIAYAITAYSKRKVDWVRLTDFDTVIALPISPLNDDEQQYIEVVINSEKGIPIGAKRNALLGKAKGKYVCFVDDDDMIMPEFFSEIAPCFGEDFDCCSLMGQYYENGEFKSDFTHSIKYTKYRSEGGVLVRPPNHLNVIKSDIAKRFTFPPLDYGEDTEWAMKISDANVLKKEHEVNIPLYFYDKRTNQKAAATVSEEDTTGKGVRFN